MSLNVIGLISGGKDSLFSLAHCVQHGHKIVALANLYPGIEESLDKPNPDDEGPDLDSFMYQTVGHSIIPLYADAIGAPLYRRAITGTALQNGRYYATTSAMPCGDETEDMYSLIADILKKHPEANALNAGAILSTYQRTRVESVAVRLGLVPLAYLWQYPALPPPTSRTDTLSGLLDDMYMSGCDARIIKIASGGIKSSMSFSNVAESLARKNLISGMAPFFADAGQEFWLRGAVLGEGGEYETLALDGPGSLWKKKIKISDFEIYEGQGGATYTRLGESSLVERKPSQNLQVPVPLQLDERFRRVQEEICTLQLQISPAPQDTRTDDLNDTMFVNRLDIKSNCVKSSNIVQLFNLTSPGSNAAEQLDSIITTLPFVLQAVAHTHDLSKGSLAPHNIVSAVLLLHSMEDFATVNQIYTTKLWPLGTPNPPARVTVATSLPREARVSLSLTYDTIVGGAAVRKGLHVQSRSYWAPANIGPYSQAISTLLWQPNAADQNKTPIPEILHLAGQIPLVPSTMSRLDGTFHQRAVLALQHLWRVAQERGCDTWVGAGVAFLANDTNVPSTKRADIDVFSMVQIAAEIWKLAHMVDEKGEVAKIQSQLDIGQSEEDDLSSDDCFDIWDLQQNRGFGATIFKPTIGEHLHCLPSRKISVNSSEQATVESSRLPPIPPLLAVEVHDLPRNESIEWWGSGVAGLISMAGLQLVEVISMPTRFHGSWSLSLTAMRESFSSIGSDNDYDEQEFAAGLQKRNICLFVALIIDLGVNLSDADTVPRTFEDLSIHLGSSMTDANASRYELVAAQSFVNLSSSYIDQTHQNWQLLQDSSIVPCHHVWSTQGTLQPSYEPVKTANSIGDNSNGDTLRQGTYHTDNIREVAAAIVMRIEAC